MEELCFEGHSILRQCLALYIRITGLQNGPNEARRGYNGRDDAIEKAHRHFKNILPGARFPAHSSYKALWGKFHIDYKQFGAISERFRACLQHFGRVQAGDEKLVHFTGDSAYVRRYSVY